MFFEDLTIGQSADQTKNSPRFKFQQPNVQAVLRQARILKIDAEQPLQSFAEGKTWSDERVRQEILSAAPELDRLAENWRSLGLGGIVLTPVGVAVAHSNARRLDAEFQAPISIWIQ